LVRIFKRPQEMVLPFRVNKQLAPLKNRDVKKVAICGDPQLLFLEWLARLVPRLIESEVP
jgi:hypothetical protein